MAMPPTKPFRMAPLQRLTVKPIEDPAEQAAIDERLRRSEGALSGDSTDLGGIPGVPATVETSPSARGGRGQLADSKRRTPARRSTHERRS